MNLFYNSYYKIERLRNLKDNFYVANSDVVKRIENFFFDKDETKKAIKVKKLEFGLYFTYDLIEKLSEKNIEVNSIVLRGSFSRLNPKSLNDDLDFVIFCKKAMHINSSRYSEKTKEAILPKLIKKVKEGLQRKLKLQDEFLEISYFVPTVPQNPYERYDMFKYSPEELEQRTYDAQFPTKNKKNFNYLQHVKRNLEIFTHYPLITNKALRIDEKVRFVDYSRFGISEEEAHGISILFDARVAGIIFAKENIIQPSDTSLKNKFIKELYPDIFDKIKESL